MAISYVGGQTATITASTATNTTITFSLTGGSNTTPAYGDLVIVSYATGSTVDRTLTMISSGYTLAADIAGADSFDANLSVWYKRMGITPDTNVIVGPTQATADGGAVTIQVYRGTAPQFPLVFTAATATGANGSAVNPPATGTAPMTGCVGVLIGAAAAGVNLTFTAAYLTSFIQAASGATTNRTQVGMGYVSVTNGTSYDGVAWTPSTTANTMSWASVTLLLQPQNVITSYSNDFESGSLTGVTQVYNGGAGASVVTGQGQGTYSLSVPVNNTGAGSGIAPTDNFNSSSLYTRVFFKVVKTANPTANTAVTGPLLRNNGGWSGSDTACGTFFFDTAGNINLLLYNFISGAYMLGTGPSITQNVWYVLDLDIIVAGGSTSTFTARLNGTQIYTSSAQNFSSAVLTGMDLVANGATNGPTATVYYDNLSYSTTALPAVTNVSTSVTGVAGTGGVGTVTVSTVASVSTTVTGVAATGGVGSATTTASANVPETGVSASGSVGSVTVVAKASTAVTGVEASAQVGTVTTVASSSTTATGVAGSGQVGTAAALTPAPAYPWFAIAGSPIAAGALSAGSSIFAAVTGVAATGAVGSLTVAGKAVVPVTGVSATGDVGSLTVTGKAVVPVTGVAASGQVGTAVATGGSVTALTGVAATGAPGTVTVVGKAAVSVTGVAASGGVGSVAVVAKANTTVTGVAASGQVGTLAVVGTAVVSVTGVAASNVVGTVTIDTSTRAYLTGVAATGAVGTATVYLQLFVPVTGVSALGQVGSLDVIGTASVPLTGVLGTSTLGNVTVFTRTPAYVIGVQANGYVAPVLVWGPIVPGQDPNYQDVTVAQAPGWVDVQGTTTSYTDVVPTAAPSYAPVNPDQNPAWVPIAV